MDAIPNTTEVARPATPLPPRVPVQQPKAEVMTKPEGDLADLASRIKAEHEAIGAAFKGALGHAFIAGALLKEAKAKLDHGKWLPWLEKHCPDIAPRTAQLYMKLAEGRAVIEANAQSVAHLLSLNEATKLISAPSSTPTSAPADKEQAKTVETKEKAEQQAKDNASTAAIASTKG
jgi:hypothetical protein